MLNNISKRSTLLRIYQNTKPIYIFIARRKLYSTSHDIFQKFLSYDPNMLDARLVLRNRLNIFQMLLYMRHVCEWFWCCWYIFVFTSLLRVLSLILWINKFTFYIPFFFSFWCCFMYPRPIRSKHQSNLVCQRKLFTQNVYIGRGLHHDRYQTKYIGIHIIMCADFTFIQYQRKYVQLIPYTIHMDFIYAYSYIVCMYTISLYNFVYIYSSVVFKIQLSKEIWRMDGSIDETKIHTK